MRNRKETVDSFCYEYEKLFGVPDPHAHPVFLDLLNKFGHRNGAFVADDPDNRLTNYKLGQQSVINHIIAMLNMARTGR